MNVLVIYESMFGNTREIADAVGEGVRGALGDEATVEVSSVARATNRIGGDVDLLIVGGPTHAFGMTRPQTREQAATQADAVPTGPGIREWIGGLGVRPGLPVAAFDTRIRKRFVPGSAARAARRRLRRLKCDVSPGSESFFVTATTGPLVTGEKERARAWGAGLVATSSRAARR